MEKINKQFDSMLASIDRAVELLKKAFTSV